MDRSLQRAPVKTWVIKNKRGAELMLQRSEKSEVLEKAKGVRTKRSSQRVHV